MGEESFRLFVVEVREKDSWETRGVFVGDLSDRYRLCMVRKKRRNKNEYNKKTLRDGKVRPIEKDLVVEVNVE